MNRSVPCVLLILLIVPFLLGGCAAALVAGGVGVGAGTIAFIKGELESTETASLDRAWAATHRAVEELEFAIKEEKKDALNARLLAKDSRDRNIDIRLERQDTNRTTVRIRIGLFGDEDDSHLILRRIRENL